MSTDSAKTNDKDTKYIGAEISEELHKEIRLRAAAEDESLAELLRQVLNDEFAE